MPNTNRTKSLIRDTIHTFSKALTFLGNLTSSGTNAFSGTNTFSGQVKHTGTHIAAGTVSPTVAYTLTASADAGKTFLATSLCRKFTLPLATAAMAGMTFGFVNAYAASAAATELWVDPVSGDKINAGTTGIGLRLQATADALGDHLVVKCDGANWWTIARYGTWAASSAA